MEVMTCVSSAGKPKAAYASEHAARAALRHSPRWRRRATLPVPYWCGIHHCWHVGRAGADV